MRQAIVCLFAAGVLAGCGSPSTTVENPIEGSGCIQLANGSKLCGDEARAWCEGFATTGDRQTAEACGPVLPAESECAAYAPGTPAFLDCTQRAEAP